jgi:antitoxin component of MazEF toxin-antitoxin module
MEKITIDILSIGGYSKAIVLPKEWLKQNNLDVGNKVKLTLDSNSITIVPYNK